MRAGKNRMILLILVAAVILATVSIFFINPKNEGSAEVLRESIKNDDVFTFMKYVDAGGDPNLLFQRGGSFKSETRPLHLAVSSGSIDVCEALIDNGADLNSSDYSGRTPIMCLFGFDVAQEKRWHLLRLLAPRSNLALTDIGGMNVLHYIAYFGNTEEYDFVSGLNDDISAAKDSTGRTPHEIVSERFGLGKGR